MMRRVKAWFPIGLVLAVVLVLAFGAKTAFAARLVADCDHCDATVNCHKCCVDWGFEDGFCPAVGHSCLCA